MAAARFGALARHFSTSVSRAQLINPPIQLFGIEGRYAHALYSAASKEKKLEQVEKELQGVQGLLQTDAKLSEFLKNPTIQKLDKQKALLEIFNKQKLSPLIINLFGSLAENGRLNRSQGVLSAFAKLMSSHRGEVTCTVTTAKPLEAAARKDVEAALKAFLKQGESLFLEMKVEPEIIGGMVVEIGDKYVDMSTASKIKTYTNLIKQAV